MQHKGTYSKNWCFFLFFIIGNFNNSAYVVVTAAAQDLSKKFGEEDLVGAFLMSLWLFAVLTRWINSKYLIKMTHYSRVVIIFVLFVTGFLIMSYTYTIPGKDTYGFFIALFGTLVIGTASTLGESVNIGKNISLLYAWLSKGFLRAFPPEYVSGYSSSTGMAGVYGTLYYILAVTLIQKYNFNGIYVSFSESHSNFSLDLLDSDTNIGILSDSICESE